MNTLTLYARSLAAVAPSMAKKDVRYYLNGVLLERLPKTGTLCAVATNGYTIAIARDEHTPWAHEAPLIVPRAAVEQMLKLAKGDQAIELERNAPDDEMEGESWTARVGEHSFTFLAIDGGRFPDYQACCPLAEMSGDEATFNLELLALFVKAGQDLKRRGVIGRRAIVGIKMICNGPDRTAGINLYGTPEGFAVGGCIAPLRWDEQRGRASFLAHLTSP